MRLDKTALDYLKDQGGDYFLIVGKEKMRHQGSGCGFISLPYIDLEVQVGHGQVPEGLDVLDLEVPVAFEKGHWARLGEETTISLESSFFRKKLALENYVEDKGPVEKEDYL